MNPMWLSQSGDMIVKMYDWSSSFDDKMISPRCTISKFTKVKPGKLIVRNSITHSEREITLLKDISWRPHDQPKQLSPPGLSFKQKWYLHDKIREFLIIVVPKPQESLQSQNNIIA